MGRANRQAEAKSNASPRTRPGRGEFEAVAEHYDYLMRRIPYAKWVDYVLALMQRHGLCAHRVLDLCCGTGRVGSEMQKRGFWVVGVDLSEQMVRRCRLQNPPLPAAVMDAARLGLRRRAFDLVVSLYDSLNYITQPAQLQSCFAGVARALRPGGAFIFDMNTEFALAAGLFRHSNLGSGDILEYDWRPTWFAEQKLCRVDMLFIWRGPGGPKRYREEHWQRAYSLEELAGLLSAAGFKQWHFYAAYGYHRPGPATDRIYCVAITPRQQKTGA